MYAAVDIGGTKTLIAAFDAHGKLLDKLKFPTPQDYSAFLTAFAAALEQFPHHDFKAACVAVPGRVDRAKGIGLSMGNLPWQDVPVRDDMARLLGCPVNIENDSKAAALSEALLLESEFRKVLYITISTGIGVGFVV